MSARLLQLSRRGSKTWVGHKMQQESVEGHPCPVRGVEERCVGSVGLTMGPGGRSEVSLPQRLREAIASRKPGGS